MVLLQFLTAMLQLLKAQGVLSGRKMATLHISIKENPDILSEEYLYSAGDE